MGDKEGRVSRASHLLALVHSCSEGKTQTVRTADGPWMGVTARAHVTCPPQVSPITTRAPRAARGGDWETAVRSHLVSEHEGDNLQHVEAPLLLSGRAGQEEEQVVHATEVNRPKKPVVDAGVIIDPLSRRRRGGEDTLSSAGDSFLPESPPRCVTKASPQTRRRQKA